MKRREWDAELILEGEHFSRGRKGHATKAEAERWLKLMIEHLKQDDGQGNYPYSVEHGKPCKVASTRVHCVWRDDNEWTYILDY